MKINKYLPSNLNKQKYLNLFRDTYGDVNNLVKRWDWQFELYPLKNKIEVFILENNQKYLATTTRYPVELKINGEFITAYFCLDSMVDPSARQQGYMSKLYQHANLNKKLLISKGTNPNMYKLLMKLGYKPVEPNTILEKHLSIPNLFLSKLIERKRQRPHKLLGLSKNYSLIKKFNDEHDKFWNIVSQNYNIIINKNSNYMNWRYVNIPFKQYDIFKRIVNNHITTIIVIWRGINWSRIVDVIWDMKISDEPNFSVQQVSDELKKNGYIKFDCWTLNDKLRLALKNNRLRDNARTPNFSIYSEDKEIIKSFYSNNLHFMDGDGDSEFIDT